MSPFVVEVITSNEFHVKLDFENVVATIRDRAGLLDLRAGFRLVSVHSDLFVISIYGIGSTPFMAAERYLAKLRPFLNAVKVPG